MCGAADDPKIRCGIDTVSPSFHELPIQQRSAAPPPRASPSDQTLLWFSAGVARMFSSAIFAVKLAMQGPAPSPPRPPPPPRPGSAPATASTPHPSRPAPPPPGNSDLESARRHRSPKPPISKVSIAATPRRSRRRPARRPRPPRCLWRRQARSPHQAPTRHRHRGAAPGPGLERQGHRRLPPALRFRLPARRQLTHPTGSPSAGSACYVRVRSASKSSELDIRQSSDTASARFVQTYRASQTLTDRKTLELVRRDGKWLILREYTAG